MESMGLGRAAWQLGAADYWRHIALAKRRNTRHGTDALLWNVTDFC